MWPKILDRDLWGRPSGRSYACSQKHLQTVWFAPIFPYGYRWWVWFWCSLEGRRIVEWRHLLSFQLSCCWRQWKKKMTDYLCWTRCWTYACSNPWMRSWELGWGSIWVRWLGCPYSRLSSLLQGRVCESSRWCLCRVLWSTPSEWGEPEVATVFWWPQ